MLLNPHLVSRIIAALWLLFALYWLIAAFRTKKTAHRQARLPLILLGFILGSLASTLYFIPALSLHLFTALSLRLFPLTLITQLLGIFLTAAGIALAIWSRRVLGANWSGFITLKQNHELIRTGPYRFVRHPIYSSLLLLAVAGTLLGQLPTLKGLAFLLLLAIAFRIKSLGEEKLLTHHFPDQYPQYKKSTKALIPFLY